ncbi:polycystic kidney disease 1-like 2, partial [Cichlidogyrus casuarinus]
IHTEHDVWKWLNVSVLPNLLAGSWYNGNSSNDQRGFLADRSSRMIGYARLRQLRVKPKKCDAQFTISQQTLCYPGYSMHSQEEGNFVHGWQRATENRKPHPWFTYNSADTLGGYPFLGVVEWYSAGGYPVNLTGTASEIQNTLDSLRNIHWIDAATRAIFLEFTVYNPNLNMFANSIGLVEFPAIGGAVVYSRVEPFYMLSYLNADLKAFQLATQVLFLVILLFYLAKEIWSLLIKRLDYFKDPWSYCELFIIIGSLAAIGFFVLLVMMLQTKAAEFKETQGDEFANFQLIAHMHEQMGYLISFLAFATTLKFIKVFQFFPKINMLGTVLILAASDLKFFILSFAIVFIGFALVFYMLFSTVLPEYITLLDTVETLFQIMLGRSSFPSIRSVEPVIGPVFFTCFSVFVVFIMVAMFIVIIEDQLDKLKKQFKDRANLSSEYKMTSFMLAKFLAWTDLPNTRIGRALFSTEQWRDYSSILDASIGLDLEDHEEKATIKNLDNLNKAVDRFLSIVKKTQIADKSDDGKRLLDILLVQQKKD